MRTLGSAACTELALLSCVTVRMQADLRRMLSQAFCVLALVKGCPVHLHYARLLLHLLVDQLRLTHDTFVYCSCPQLTPSHLRGTLAFNWDQVSSSSASMRSI